MLSVKFHEFLKTSTVEHTHFKCRILIWTNSYGPVTTTTKIQKTFVVRLLLLPQPLTTTHLFSVLNDIQNVK